MQQEVFACLGHKLSIASASAGIWDKSVQGAGHQDWQIADLAESFERLSIQAIDMFNTRIEHFGDVPVFEKKKNAFFSHMQRHVN